MQRNAGGTSCLSCLSRIAGVPRPRQLQLRLRGRHYRRHGHHQGDLLPAGALFFLGYFFFQIPGAIYAERRSVRKLIFICLILWGGCASLTGIVHNIPALAAIRFILGVVEAAVMPAMLIYISNWFTKSERSRANTFLILGNPVTVLWMSVVSGYLIQAFGWREMFIIEGVPAVIWAFCWWVLVKDKPSQVSRLAESEKRRCRNNWIVNSKASKRCVTMAKPSAPAT